MRGRSQQEFDLKVTGMQRQGEEGMNGPTALIFSFSLSLTQTASSYSSFPLPQTPFLTHLLALVPVLSSHFSTSLTPWATRDATCNKRPATRAMRLASCVMRQTPCEKTKRPRYPLDGSVATAKRVRGEGESGSRVRVPLDGHATRHSGEEKEREN